METVFSVLWAVLFFKRPLENVKPSSSIDKEYRRGKDLQKDIYKKRGLPTPNNIRYKIFMPSPKNVKKIIKRVKRKNNKKSPIPPVFIS
ncbi:MAG: hypothetical protein JXA79_12850 [Deltaproteobacteria bacterium]|nr:hypothetical protein [Deltaproteobacteria bacterium]